MYDMAKVEEVLRSNDPVGPVLGDFCHLGHRWAFNNAQLLWWNPDDQGFEMYGFHSLVEPSTESVIALINTL
ncbi:MULTISPECIES: hypothetical protein [Pseudomonas]|uniref:hypothetical protein n=1 Tax=Pseudomonas TaxID=286 RepID=UPI0007DC0636|nr:hypothetical protein [Pseudomonas putida]OAS07782.1 hypothetical protein AYO08_10685 [Pseudomonas putida]QNV69390.1 hypothetical protein F7661_28135 [Pseudomonas sp. CFA]